MLDKPQQKTLRLESKKLESKKGLGSTSYATVTDLARFLGLSGLYPFLTAK